MARVIGKLSVLGVKATTKPGLYADGGGLNLRVDKGGAKSWTLRFMLSGKAREMGLGSTSTVSLADARRRAQELRDELKHEGRDPIEARKAKREAARAEQVAMVQREAASRTTFGVVVDEFLRQNEKQWRNAKHRQQWRVTLETYAAHIWNMPVSQIDTPTVLACLRPIWNTKNETAVRTRQRIERVLDAARVLGHRSGENPARWRGNLDAILPRVSKRDRGHHAAMPFSEVGAFVRDLRAQPSVTARALEFLILTAARSGEVRGAVWSEVDLEAAVWTVPADRMKAGKEHRVPLVARAVEILRGLAAFAPQIDGAPKKDALVFPSVKAGGVLSDMTLSMHMRRMGHADATPHGFRASFRTWVTEATNTPREVAEACLAHTVGDATEQAYARGDMFERRRVLMAAWYDYIEQQPASNVVAFSRPGVA
jgi:integrase